MEDIDIKNMFAPKVESWLEDPEPASAHSAFEDHRKKFLLVEGSSTAIDLRRYDSPVEDQRWLNSCVGNAVIGMLESLRISAGLEHVDLSRLFIYYNARNEHGKQTIDSGTYIRSAMQSLQKFGVCREETWEYNTNKVFVRPSWMAYREAYTNKITDFYRIRSTGEERLDMIEEAIKARHPVVFGMRIDKAFSENTTGQPIISYDSKWAGRHAMLIVGFNRTTRTLIIKNSWGVQWGEKGYCYLQYDALNIAGAGDFWVMHGLK